jgi:hypothetical protein
MHSEKVSPLFRRDSRQTLNMPTTTFERWKDLTSGQWRSCTGHESSLKNYKVPAIKPACHLVPPIIENTRQRTASSTARPLCADQQWCGAGLFGQLCSVRFKPRQVNLAPHDQKDFPGDGLTAGMGRLGAPAATVGPPGFRWLRNGFDFKKNPSRVFWIVLYS